MTDEAPIVEYESVATDSFQAGHNHGWKVLPDGRVYTRRNAPDAERPDDADIWWYEAPFPDEPSYTLDPPRLATLQAWLEETFAAWPAHVREGSEEDTEHGGWDRLRLRLARGPVEIEVHSSRVGRMRELIHPVLERIRRQT